MMTNLSIPAEALRILAVEDSEDDAFLLRAELEGIGTQLAFRRVDSEASMRAALNDDEWDVVVSDHALPQFSSTDALRVLRETGKDVPFIIYSGTISEQLAVAAMDQGVADCVPKGQAARLLPSIRRELRSAETRRAKEQAESHVFRLAYFDALTELPNRHLFLEHVARVIAEQSDSGGAVFYVGLDHFRRINDTFGYAVGDSLMRQIADRLRGQLHREAFVARLGGDEFGAFRPGPITDGEAASFGERILQLFAQPFMHEKLEFFITATVGASCHARHGNEALDLIKSAESAMAYAKLSTSASMRLFSRELGEASTRRFELEAALRRAVTRDELVLHYQPVTDGDGQRILGTEALLRWQHAEFGLLPPDRFIPLADETGLIIEIGAWVLREACRQTRQWEKDGLGTLTVSVNVSAVQFAQPRFIAQVDKVLRDTGIEPERLELEITESVLMRDAGSTIATLRALKAMGVRISVDDFGTGYSSLSYLKRFPIDVLKIDQSFTRDILDADGSSEIVAAIAALAQSLNLATHAEGVETAHQFAFLRTLRCNRMQGYLYSPPLPPPQMERFLLDR